MVQTRSGKLIHPTQGLQPKPLGKKKAKKLLKQQVSASANNSQVRKVHGEIKALRRARAYRLQREILGTNRTFPGAVIIPTPEVARAKDEQRLMDIHAAIRTGVAIVYWADGSHSASGYLGAGVAWRGPEMFWYQTYHLGRHTGASNDAELFAIAAALGRAKKAVGENEQIQLVRIYTDAKAVLEGLANGSQSEFGPMINPKTALQGVYERAEWLLARGIKLELIWVKGHAESEGNKWADQAATRAVQEQLPPHQQGKKISGRRRSLMTLGDIPSMFNEKGPDWAEEWLSRANAHIFQQGLVPKTSATNVQQTHATIVHGTNATTVQDWSEGGTADGTRDKPFVLD